MHCPFNTRCNTEVASYHYLDLTDEEIDIGKTNQQKLAQGPIAKFVIHSLIQ